MRRSPFYARERGARRGVLRRPRLGAAAVVRVATPTLVEQLPAAVRPRRTSGTRRWWSPITNAEHLAMRDQRRHGRPHRVQRVRLRRARARSTTCSTCASTTSTCAVGRSVYTPLLTPHGGFRGDLTIMRLGDEHFRVITGAFDGGRDKYWFRAHLPDRRLGHVHRQHLRHRARSACGVPNAEATMAKIVTGQSKPYDVSQAGFPYGAVREVLIDGVAVHDVPHLLRRRERLGDLHHHRARPARVGHDLGRRRGVRHRARRHRRVRRHRPASRRATA